MKYITNKIKALRDKLIRGFKYAIKKQCQLALRFILSFLFFSILLFIFRPRSVEYHISPEFKTIQGEYKTTLWNNGYHDKICSRERVIIGPFWTQQCILSSLQLPVMKSNQVIVEVRKLQYQSISAVKLCRFIDSINKSVCEERFVTKKAVEIVDIDLEDVVFLSIALRLKEGIAYASHPAIVVHTNPNIIVLLIHRYYFISSMIMCSIFACIVSLALILKDILYYSDPSKPEDSSNRDLSGKQKGKKK